MKTQRKLINVSGRQINCVIKGEGRIPCIVAGPAGLFAKEGMMPDSLGEFFTFFCVDTWEISEIEKSESKSDVNWDILLSEIEDIRKQLKLEKVGIFGHSAAGPLALEYARNYPEKCLLAIAVAFPSDWSPGHQVERFISLDFDEKRKSTFSADQREYLKKKPSMTPRDGFIQSFHANRALFWVDYDSKETKKEIQTMWHGYHPNVDKIGSYSQSLLSSYNFFERQKIKPIQVPVFLGLGIGDRFSPFDLWADKLTADPLKYKNITCYLFGNSAHYPMREEPKEFSDAIERFAQESMDCFPRPKL